MSEQFLDRLTARMRATYVNFVQPRTISVHGKRIGLDYKRYPKIVIEGLSRGWYEEAELGLIEQLARQGRIVRGMRVMDIGSALGLTSMRIADIVGDDAVVGYEADPATAADCRRNLEFNRHRYAVHHAAMVSGNEDHVTFNIHPELWASSLLTLGETTEAVSVPARNFTRELEAFRPHVIMMDVEGAEVDLLTSVRDFGAVSLILVEQHPAIIGEGRLDAMAEHLSTHGFEKEDLTADAVALFSRPTVRH